MGWVLPLVSGLVWEGYALATRRVPTLSESVWRRPVTRVVAASACAWGALHFAFGGRSRA